MCLVDIAHAESGGALLRHAIDLFPERDIHVAYVMPYGFYSYVEPFVSEESQKAAAARAHDELGALVSGLRAELTLHVLRGGIGEQSLRLAAKLKASIIVLNAMRSESTHVTLGTHAAQIARHAECSVHLVRHQANAAGYG
nr:universal stress protein [Roseibium hamelinense]